MRAALQYASTNPTPLPPDPRQAPQEPITPPPTGDAAAEATEEAKPEAVDPLAELSAKVTALETEKKALKDQLLRALAEQENIRGIAARDVSAARNFAITKMAKSLLDTSDNLTRSLEAVPEDMREDKEGHPVLATLYEGIKMTDMLFEKALQGNNIAKFGEVGEAFDPNMHNAMFEYEDPEREGGTLGQVMKVGFTLNNRVIRPADVGTIKKK
jgi:molecular chaperone GrpE